MQNPSISFDVAVVGGGAIGLSVAWRAAARGLKVVLLERGEPGAGASWVAAGMLAPVSEANATEQPLLALGLASARAYPRFAVELHEAAGREAGYLPCGTLAVARDGDEAQALTRELAMRQSLGLAVRRLRPSEARHREPSLAPTLRLALEVVDDHAIDPRVLSSALVEAARRAGVDVRAGAEVRGVLLRGDQVRGLCLATGEEVLAEQVVLAAGAWSAKLEGIPEQARVPIYPVKGQILRMHDPGGPGLLSRVLRMGEGYIVPRGDGRYVLGATMEERGFDTTVTAGAAFELLRAAVEILPGVSELVIDELSAGLRPATPDNAPLIGSGVLEGLHWASGHHRNGILMAPITAQIMASVLAGGDVPELARPFAPSRFGERRAGEAGLPATLVAAR